VQVVVQGTSQVANDLFLNALSTEEGRAKVALGAASYIKMRLREESFARKIMMPVAVSKAEVVALSHS
jgi:hypothetical protein